MLNARQLEKANVLEPDKDAPIKIQVYVKLAYLAVGKSNGELIISVCGD